MRKKVTQKIKYQKKSSNFGNKNKIKLIEPDASKIFGKNKDNINDNKFDLDFDVSTISSRLADGTIDSCSCISDSSVIQMTGNCGFAHTY